MKMNRKAASEVILTAEGLQGSFTDIQGKLPTLEVFISFHKTGSFQKDELILEDQQEAEGYPWI